MCNYCGCRKSGPTSELATEHQHLLRLAEILHRALHDGEDVGTVFAEFVRLLEMHAAKEEIGLFDHGQSLQPLADQIEVLCREHADLRRWLADGPTGLHVADALQLLVTHIDDEEYKLFPRLFHALDPEQWDEIELAHRAIETVWNDDIAHSHRS